MLRLDNVSTYGSSFDSYIIVERYGTSDDALIGIDATMHDQHAPINLSLDNARKLRDELSRLLGDA